jgi:PAS domain S-box-containing protein
MQFKSPADNADFHSALLHVYCTGALEFVGAIRSGSRHFLCVNEPGAALFGFSNAAELLRYEQDILKNLTDDELQFSLDMNTAAHTAREVVFVTKQGHEFLGAVRADGFIYHGNHYVLIRITDISSVRQNEQAGRREKERFEALFNFASIGILLADSTGTIIIDNEHARGLFGYSQQNGLKGKKVEALIPERFRHSHVHHREGYQKKPQPRMMGGHLDLFALRSDGTEFPVEISLSNFATDEGAFVIAFVIDITRRKQAEASMLKQQQEIEKLNDELEARVELRTRQLQETMQMLEQSKEELSKSLSKEKELGDMKSRFVSMASHEFRTPLSTILSSASLLAKYTQTEEQEKRDKHIVRIKSSVSNLTDILNDFLSIGKMEDGKILASPITFNLRELLHNTATEMQGHIKSGQEIAFDFNGDETVFLDPALLRNAVINLLSNAIKFSPENKKIILTGLNGDDCLSITVKDSGIGISEDDQKHLFERFFRAKNAVNIQGTGLGLHIVAKYVELLGGDIECKSELEAGTEFVIKFVKSPTRVAYDALS